MINYDYKKYDTEILPLRQDIYAKKGNYSLPINIFAPKVKNERNKIAVLCVHGGGWTSNLKENVKWNGCWMRHQAKYYSMLGFFAFEISYRSINVPGFNMKDMVDDVKDAMKYINENLVKEFSIEKIVSIGDSAGGHLVLTLALDDDEKMRPFATIPCNPVSDVASGKWQEQNKDVENPEKISPYHMAKKVDTKFLFMHGNSDSVVDINATYKMMGKLRELGNDVEYYEVNKATHAFILYGYQTAPEVVDKCMDITLEFIDRVCGVKE